MGLTKTRKCRSRKDKIEGKQSKAEIEVNKYEVRFIILDVTKAEVEANSREEAIQSLRDQIGEDNLTVMANDGIDYKFTAIKKR